MVKFYYYKFVIRLTKKLSEADVSAIKKAIQKVLIDTPITDIKGGIGNNNSSYYKFETKSNYKVKNGRC
jgi:hypothetical protein